MPERRFAGGLYTVGAGVPFLDAVARALLDGRIIRGFPDRSDPLSLARATIYTPTSRAASALGAAILRASRGDALALPRIQPLGRIENPTEDHEAFSPRAMTGEIGEIERRVVLARMIRTWAASVNGASLADEPSTAGRSPPLILSSFGGAWALAGELAGLIDELNIENADLKTLTGVVPGDFDEFWKITFRFLEIAIKAWPDHLAERGLADASARQVVRTRAVAESVSAGRLGGPTLVVGSTGTNAATAELIEALVNAADCAVVLPPLDAGLDEDCWRALLAERPENVATHPQFALAWLLARIGARPADVVELESGPTYARDRASIVSDAMRPATFTRDWVRLRATRSAASVERALENVSFVEAIDEREESACVAVAVRKALASGKSVAVVTPDRDLGKRVSGQLARWGVAVEESAGVSVASSEFGRLARLLVRAARERSPVSLSAMLTTGASSFGLEADAFDRAARMLDLALLRSGLDLDDERLVETAREFAATGDGDVLPRSYSEEDWSDVAALWRAVTNALGEFASVPEFADLGAWAGAHRRAIQKAARPPSDDDRRMWDELDDLLAMLARDGARGDLIAFEDYIDVFDQIASSVAVRAGDSADVVILGLLEARLLSFDVVVACGLDEGVWPPPARVDAFLNRAMRSALGMSVPERRIGQTAHDFTQALGAREVVLTRARKRGGAPGVPSRFLQRVATFVGADAWASCERRGAEIAALARLLDARSDPRIEPPRPKPRLELRPTTLSVTQIETLRREPYSIYARCVLGLRPIRWLGESAGPREIGLAFHATIMRYSRLAAARDRMDVSIEALMRLAEEEFAGLARQPGFHAFRWPGIERALVAFHGWDITRAVGVESLLVEAAGALELTLGDGSLFTLIARADRIERRSDGSAFIADFKTGRLPTAKEINAGFAPQLVLESAILRQGGFGAPSPADVEAAYVKLGGRDNLDMRWVGDRQKSLAALTEEQSKGLLVLLNQLRDPRTAYISRPYVQFLSRFGAYDHLARVKEWSIGGASEGAE